MSCLCYRKRWFHLDDVLHSTNGQAKKVKCNLLTLPLGEVATRVAFELDAGLDKEWIVVDHNLEISPQVCCLDMVAYVVESTSTDIPARPFKLVGSIFHLVPVFFIHAFGNLIHADLEGHDFDALEHSDEEGLLVVEVLDGGDQIHGLVNVQVNLLDLLLQSYHLTIKFGFSLVIHIK